MDYGFYRRALLTDPACTQEAMALVNRYRYFIGQKEKVHPVRGDLRGSLGSILYRQRVGAGYSLEALASLCGVSRDVMRKVERGWLVPAGEEGQAFLATIAVYCGFTPMEYYQLVDLAERELNPAPRFAERPSVMAYA